MPSDVLIISLASCRGQFAPILMPTVTVLGTFIQSPSNGRTLRIPGELMENHLVTGGYGHHSKGLP